MILNKWVAKLSFYRKKKKHWKEESVKLTHMPSLGCICCVQDWLHIGVTEIFNSCGLNASYSFFLICFVVENPVFHTWGQDQKSSCLQCEGSCSLCRSVWCICLASGKSLLDAAALPVGRICGVDEPFCNMAAFSELAWPAFLFSSHSCLLVQYVLRQGLRNPVVYWWRQSCLSVSNNPEAEVVLLKHLL